MAELPALPLGGGRRRDRSTRASPRPKLQGPGADRQAQRLDDSLTRLTQAFEAGRLQAEREAGGLEPELVLVMEIAGELGDFYKAVSKVKGLEFLAEEVEDSVEPDEFAAVDRDGKEHRYVRQLLLVASDRGAWEQLLGLWRRYQDGESFPRGLTPFRHVFERLRELRPWDDRDRVERSGALAVWRQELADLGEEPVLFEVELWLRHEAARRETAIANLRADLEAVGGELLVESIHEAIGYHGALGRVPASQLNDIVEHKSVRWLRTESVRFFHAVGQMTAPEAAEGETEEWNGKNSAPGLSSPRLALLDGVPLANHEALEGRIVVDDPEGWEAVSPVRRRLHATSMSSVLIHGDMSVEGSPLQEPIYVRPILRAEAPEWYQGDAPEAVPRDRLVVDLIQGAIARLFEDDAQAPEVRVVVIAIGDAAIQFDQFISPLARLLDWLSDRHGILFILSAGNHTVDIEIPGECDLDDPEEVQHEILCALQKDAPMRRLLCPGESVNALTVGAAHGDLSEALVEDGRLEPIVNGDLANVVSAQGSGARRAVKPDVLFPGGRQTLSPEPAEGDAPRRLSVTMTRRAPGVKHATVGPVAGDLKALAYASGTSVATALAGHRAWEILAELDDLRRLHGEEFPATEFDSVLVKAAIAHGSHWGAARALIDATQEDLGRPRSRMAVGRLIGYGLTAPQSPLVCDENCVTVVGAGRLIDGKADAFSFPLPLSLASSTIRRRISLTLAWITPINPSHRHYRRAALKLDATGYGPFAGKRVDAEAAMVGRGTLQREVFESEAAVPFAKGNAIELLVSCRADAGELAGSVRYALLATIETPSAAELPIYEEIREALKVPIRIRTR
jgi:hypothetical protein